MAQLLDRYRRVDDGKEFAVVSLGSASDATLVAASKSRLVLEAEDGERVESQASAVRGQGPFEWIED